MCGWSRDAEDAASHGGGSRFNACLPACQCTQSFRPSVPRRPGGMVRLAHAVVTNFLLAFKVGLTSSGCVAAAAAAASKRCRCHRRLF